MVGVAQLVELRIVIPVVAGSSPVVHPKFKTTPLEKAQSQYCAWRLSLRRSPQIQNNAIRKSSVAALRVAVEPRRSPQIQNNVIRKSSIVALRVAVKARYSPRCSANFKPIGQE